MAEPIREQAIYLPPPVVDVLLHEAARLERSVSWCVHRA
jgi:hypothetical protein